jgi:CheY-like chemotaxis protein
MELTQATVLLVDDEPALVDIIGKWLRMEGCAKVLTASDGEEALQVLAGSHVDLLITDVRMPRVDGTTLVRRLAELPRPCPSVIFVSGFGDVDQREMYALGVESFLAKPFQRHELLTSIRNALADRGALWHTPLPSPPRQTISAGSIRLGRGGFAAFHQAPLALGHVAFSCRLPEDDRTVSGQGIVRWYARAEHITGVEFVFLDPACSGWVAETIRAANLRCFIPRLPPDSPDASAPSNRGCGPP